MKLTIIINWLNGKQGNWLTNFLYAKRYTLYAILNTNDYSLTTI